MKKIYLSLILTCVLATVFGCDAFAATGTVKVKTAAPAGTELRIYAYPYGATVSGADAGKYTTTFISRGEGSEITISTEGLSQLEIYGCQLTSLDASGAPDLFILKCYNNLLTALDVSKCDKLEVLECQNNEIETLDVSKNNILANLNVSDNKLTSLVLGAQPELAELKCSSNPLTGFDVKQCPELKDLYFDNCNVTSLDLSYNSKLEWVFAYNNGLKGESMSDFIDSMPEARTNGLIYIVDTRADKEENVCTMDDVRSFTAKGWITMDYLGGTGSETQIGKFYPGCDYVPTVSERKISLTTTRQAGETITLNISTTASISITGVKETAASGKLAYTLTDQTVEILGDVTSFECQESDVTSLTFSDPSLLRYIDCRKNKIESLNLSGAKALTQLYCQENALTQLNVDECTSLMRVDCYDNQLKGKEMRAFVNSLYQADDSPYLFIIDTKATDGAEGNVATTEDVKIAKDKGWEIFDYNGGANYGMGIPYAGSEPTEPTLPEQYFTVTRSELDYIMITAIFADKDYTPVIEGGSLSGWNGSGMTILMQEETIKIYGDALNVQALFATIESIDVSHLPNLTELNVALNDITALDLSGNPLLTTLSCEGNLLESLDLSHCPDLDFVNCYGNKITGENMSAMIASLPTRTAAAPGQLIVYDPTYTHENNVCLKSDVAAARAKYWITCQLDDNGDAIIYEGADGAGIEDLTGDVAMTYDAASATVTLACAARIEVYTAGGVMVKKADNATSLSLATLPAGVYVVRSGNLTLKVVK